jgi:phytoene dehydrogenase-like protein
MKTGRSVHDAIIVGAGPNGLAAAITLAREGLSTLVVEAADTPGGGCRSGSLMDPHFVHDYCSSVHPLGRASPFFRSLGLEQHGLSWVDPSAEVAHVLDEERVVLLERSLDATAAQLGRDGPAYRSLFAELVERFDELLPMVLAPLRFPASPWFMARFGLKALRSMRGLAAGRFAERPARALLAGIAAHAMLPLDALATSSFALVLASAGHAVGWPIARGGSQAITTALVSCLKRHGGDLVLGQRVEHLSQLPPARAYLLDVTPKQLLRIAGDQLPSLYRSRLARFRYGPGVCKVDWTLRGPIPWRQPDLARAATVHLSGTFSEVEAAERTVHQGQLSAQPFILLVQPSLFDDSRAPPGLHTAWAYCHVPHGSDADTCAAIEAHIERFAPGFRDVVLGRAVKTAVGMESYNPNYVGGDINGGVSSLSQLFFRPMAKVDPYATPLPNLFLCSSSTPPGGGVHGMCGYWAAQSALARVFGRHAAPTQVASGGTRVAAHHA